MGNEVLQAGGGWIRGKRRWKAGTFGSTSVMAWCGYDAPQTIPQAGLDGYADGGAGSLDRFQDGLRASHDGTH
ncbi:MULTISPECIES: alpha/beta hydrolase [Rhodococcus]|uniref:DUF1023 domain-containing protein n=1 Tax=Rhodococcus erythropolis TaxID=1833 RepID=A0A8I1D8A8_RHOER|nr:MULTISPECIES: alpha/beta hydrolase [Rhodococcus]MBH5144524.1 hypothetical protein [Rhodococcus erythropolis]